MTADPDPPDTASDAEDAFVDFLSRRESGEDVELEEVCAARPELANELRSLWDDHRALTGILDKVSRPLSGARRITESFGGDVDPGVSLDAAEAPGAGGDAREMLDRVASPIHGAERYDRRDEIARGGMGTVFRVWDRDLRRILAMKVLRPTDRLPWESRDRRADKRRLSRFLEEAQITGQLDHPGIVPVHDIGMDGRGRVYFTMRLVRGRDLSHVLSLVHRGLDGWNPTRAVGVIQRVCEAMAYAHAKGVVHRDLKPSNVMVGRFGQVYVMDWGLARVLSSDPAPPPELPEPPEEEQFSTAIVRTHRLDESSSNPDSPLLTRDGEVVGTPAYMPPEQAHGRIEDVGPWSDVYSMGAILYHLLTGEMPYVERGEEVGGRDVLQRILHGAPRPIESLAPRADPELVSIANKAMARAISDRYASMKAMADDLRAYLESRVVQAHRTGAWQEFKKWMRRNRGMAASIGVSIALVVVALGAIGLIETLRRKEIERLSDLQILRELREEADALWPATPPLEGALEEWLARAEDLTGRLAIHRRNLARLEARADFPGFGGDEALRWEHANLTGLVRDLERFSSEEGAMTSVRRRIRTATSLPAETLEGPRAAWADAIDAIADRARSPAYDGLRIAPQLGLVPVGRDPASGLWEFAHVLSGEIPERTAEDRLLLDGESAVVLVLLPAGSVRMGEAGSRFAEERRVHRVDLDPFFLAKHETTQGQWRRLTGENPSTHAPGEGSITLSHPVEDVSWHDCERALWRAGLALPTEAQWEYACRAGTDSIYWSGDDLESLAGAANLADQSAHEAAAPAGWGYEHGFRDGFVLHGPVDAFAPNGFGLVGMAGNVWEWCLDRRGSYELPVAPGTGERLEAPGPERVARGGGFNAPAECARSAHRSGYEPRNHYYALGARAARPLRR